MGYGEFMVNEAFAEDLMDGGMTHVNGAPVRLTTVDWLPHLGCVQLRWSPTETLEEMAASDAVSEARS